MSEDPEYKSTTRKILISEPDEDQLQQYLQGRTVSADLNKFLRSMVNGKRWTRKINIPSIHDNLAAVLVFSSELKQGGLEITSELHVFFEDRAIVERWEVLGEHQHAATVSREMLHSLQIDKVRLDGDRRVRVALKMAGPGGQMQTAERLFDFDAEHERVRVVPNPFLA